MILELFQVKCPAKWKVECLRMRAGCRHKGGVERQRWDAELRAECRSMVGYGGEGMMWWWGWDEQPGQTRSSCPRALSPNTSCILSLSTDTQPCLFTVISMPFSVWEPSGTRTTWKSISAGKQQCAPEISWLAQKHAITHKIYLLLQTAEGHTVIQHLYYCNYQDVKNWFVTCSTGVRGGGYDLLSVVSLVFGACHLIRQICPYFWFILPLFQSVSLAVFGKSTCHSSIVLHQQISENFTKWK